MVFSRKEEEPLEKVRLRNPERIMLPRGPVGTGLPRFLLDLQSLEHGLA